MTTKSELLRGLTSFEEGYIDALLWTERVDFDSDEHLDDAGYDAGDLTKASLESVIADCQGFIEQAQAVEHPDEFPWDDRDYDAENLEDSSQAGHDFLLTRNGHGAGFWDRGIGAWGTTLTDIAKTFGSTYAYAHRGHVYVD